MIKKVLLRLPNDLHEQIKLLAKQFNISINKMYIKILKIYITLMLIEI